MKRSTLLQFHLPRLATALILLQSLYFKFTGHPDALHIFGTLGVEPWGRIALGLFELMAGILLLLPRTAWLGSILGLGLMVGAIFAHFTILGIEVNDDGGGLFALASIALLGSGILVFNQRHTIACHAERLHLLPR